MSEFWQLKLGLPCVRVATNLHNFPNRRGYHGKDGDLLLYLDCRREGRSFFWRIVNLETGEQVERRCSGWKPERYLAECSKPLESM